ncbi:hypothetical protein T484DRAFT_2021803 [Baffinella frigidus]|nr:hypothetical protein T484DRAFT_2021803 [Cryptophyta sp. CCMP2293]
MQRALTHAMLPARMRAVATSACSAAKLSGAAARVSHPCRVNVRTFALSATDSGSRQGWSHGGAGAPMHRWLAAGGALAAAAALGGGHADMAEAETLEFVSGLDGGAPPLEVGAADEEEKKSVGEVVQAVLKEIQAAISLLIEKLVAMATARFAQLRGWYCYGKTPAHTTDAAWAVGTIDAIYDWAASLSAQARALLSSSSSSALPAAAASDTPAALLAASPGKPAETPTAGGEGQVAKAPEEAVAPASVPKPPVFGTNAWIEENFFFFIALTVGGGVIGVLIARRHLDSEARHYASKITKVAKETASSPNHVRRATSGGPLQVTQQHAVLVREAMGVASTDVRVTEAFGRPLREGRFNASVSINGRMEGSFKVTGPAGKVGEVRIVAIKPNGAKPDVETAKPGVETAKPDVETAKPDVETAKPADRSAYRITQLRLRNRGRRG